MSDKLFNIKPKPIKRTFTLKAYKGNRVAIKLMKLLKTGGIYNVKRTRDNENFITFEILINSERNEKAELDALINEIVSYIPDNFPPNYQFGVNKMKLGFVYSFDLEIGGRLKWFSHRIKEVKKNTILPETQIFM